MPSFEQDHFFLLKLSTILEPKSSYHFDYTYSSIDSLLDQETWNPHVDGPIPSEAVDCTPQHWYTQYWSECTALQQTANLDGYYYRDLCDYEFYNDETIYTGHPLDLY